MIVVSPPLRPTSAAVVGVRRWNFGGGARVSPDEGFYDDEGSWLRMIVIALSTVLILSACGEPSTTDVAGQPSPDGGRWGPLAVTPADGGGGEALIQGMLQVTDECVLLDEQGEDVLLAWDVDQVTWNADERTITFENGDGTTTVADGDHVRLSGGGSSVEEGGAPPEQWAEGIDWISEPAPSCLTDTRWSVGDVEKISN